MIFYIVNQRPGHVPPYKVDTSLEMHFAEDVTVDALRTRLGWRCNVDASAIAMYSSAAKQSLQGTADALGDRNLVHPIIKDDDIAENRPIYVTLYSLAFFSLGYMFPCAYGQARYISRRPGLSWGHSLQTITKDLEKRFGPHARAAVPNTYAILQSSDKEADSVSSLRQNGVLVGCREYGTLKKWLRRLKSGHARLVFVVLLETLQSFDVATDERYFPQTTLSQFEFERMQTTGNSVAILRKGLSFGILPGQCEDLFEAWDSFVTSTRLISDERFQDEKVQHGIAYAIQRALPLLVILPPVDEGGKCKCSCLWSNRVKTVMHTLEPKTGTGLCKLISQRASLFETSLKAGSLRHLYAAAFHACVSERKCLLETPLQLRCSLELGMPSPSSLDGCVAVACIPTRNLHLHAKGSFAEADAMYLPGEEGDPFCRVLPMRTATEQRTALRLHVVHGASRQRLQTLRSHFTMLDDVEYAACTATSGRAPERLHLHLPGLRNGGYDVKDETTFTILLSTMGRPFPAEVEPTEHVLVVRLYSLPSRPLHKLSPDDLCPAIMSDPIDVEADKETPVSLPEDSLETSVLKLPYVGRRASGGQRQQQTNLSQEGMKRLRKQLSDDALFSRLLKQMRQGLAPPAERCADC